jgi:hypothetical protein
LSMSVSTISFNSNMALALAKLISTLYTLNETKPFLSYASQFFSNAVSYIIGETHIKALIQVWAGRDLNPRTPPCQGGILTKLDHRPFYK